MPKIDWDRIDTDRIDDAVLALMLLGLHDYDKVWNTSRAWKSFDWEATQRLYDKGYISDPKGKAKSVVITEEGQAKAEALFQAMFLKPK